MEEIIKQLREFRDQRDWKQFHNPKDLANAISIETAELMEHFLWKTQEESYEKVKNNPKIAEEVADIMIFLIYFAETSWIDIEKAVKDKIEKNNKKYSVEKSKWKSNKYTEL